MGLQYPEAERCALIKKMSFIITGGFSVFEVLRPEIRPNNAHQTKLKQGTG